jgi:hypothetical protein
MGAISLMEAIIISSVIAGVSLTVSIILRGYAIGYLKAHKHSKYDNFRDFIYRNRPGLYRGLNYSDSVFLVSVVFFLVTFLDQLIFKR